MLLRVPIAVVVKEGTERYKLLMIVFHWYLCLQYHLHVPVQLEVLLIFLELFFFGIYIGIYSLKKLELKT